MQWNESLDIATTDYLSFNQGRVLIEAIHGRLPWGCSGGLGVETSSISSLGILLHALLPYGHHMY